MLRNKSDHNMTKPFRYRDFKNSWSNVGGAQPVPALRKCRLLSGKENEEKSQLYQGCG